MSGRALIDLAVELVPPYETDKAYHVSDGTTTDWVAKSLVEWDASDRNPNIGTMTMPEWLAKEKGFI